MQTTSEFSTLIRTFYYFGPFSVQNRKFEYHHQIQDIQIDKSTRFHLKEKFLIF